MCDPATRSLIDQVVTDLTSNNVMFTALDAVRKLWALQGHSEDDRWPSGFYNDHKGDIHAAMYPIVSSGAYAKTLADVGAPTRAFVYYPAGADPSLYTPLPRQDAATPAPTVAGVSSMATSAPSAPTVAGVSSMATAVPDSAMPNLAAGRDSHFPLGQLATNPKQGQDTGDPSNGWQRGLTPYNRLCVPNTLLRGAGFATGDTAYLEVDSGEVRIVKNSSAPVATYVVDEDCNVRAVAGTLAKAGLDTGKQFKFSGDATKVVIRNA